MSKNEALQKELAAWIKHKLKTEENVIVKREFLRCAFYRQAALGPYLNEFCEEHGLIWSERTHDLTIHFRRKGGVE